MIKANLLKRKPGEQISVYATRIVDLYDKLQALHPTKDMSNGLVRTDSINKLLELLPNDQRLWIKTNNPVTHTFYNVLHQVIELCETNKSLKLSMEEINKEQKVKQGTREVDNITSSQTPIESKSKPTPSQTVNNVSNTPTQPDNSNTNKSNINISKNYQKNPNDKDKEFYYCYFLGHTA